MRKLIIVFVIVSLTLFCGCAVRTQDVTSGRELGKEVLRCFDEEDSEGLKALFCEEIQNTHNLDKEIAGAMNLFDGEITTSNPKIVLINSGESIDNGIVTRSDKIYQICDIKTDTGKTYEILFHMYTSNDDESKIGITNILLTDSETNQEIRMGDNLKK